MYEAPSAVPVVLPFYSHFIGTGWNPSGPLTAVHLITVSRNFNIFHLISPNYVKLQFLHYHLELKLPTSHYKTIRTGLRALLLRPASTF